MAIIVMKTVGGSLWQSHKKIKEKAPRLNDEGRPSRCARPGKRQTMNDSAIVAREKGIFNERNQNQSADP